MIKIGLFSWLFDRKSLPEEPVNLIESKLIQPNIEDKTIELDNNWRIEIKKAHFTSFDSWDCWRWYVYQGDQYFPKSVDGYDLIVGYTNKKCDLAEKRARDFCNRLREIDPFKVQVITQNSIPTKFLFSVQWYISIKDIEKLKSKQPIVEIYDARFDEIHLINKDYIVDVIY